MKKNIVRLEYKRAHLSESEIHHDPYVQFIRWWDDAIAAGILMVDAVHLATVDEKNRPDARIVLLKEFDDRGFVFFTNYESAKAKQLKATPFAAITIFWPELERQIRIRGAVEKTSTEESHRYFKSRPRGSQIGANISPQSKVIKDRASLDDAYKKMDHDYRDQDLPHPPHWGGFRLVPDFIEFWQGGENRLHDRFLFTRTSNDWRHARLAP